jgi:hypothetical protein
VRLPGLTGREYRVSDDACYRAMDWLISIEAQLARGVFDAVTHLLNLEVDLIFFDTTSTYLKTEQADEPVWRDDRGRVVETRGEGNDEGNGEGQRRRPGWGGREGRVPHHGKSKDSRDDLP